MIKWLLVSGVLLPTPDLLAQLNHLPGQLLSASVRQVGTRTRPLHVQAIVVTGKVTDEKGAGLPGASVSLKGTNIGTNTDAQGNYSIRVPDGNEGGSLVISFVGYAAQEFPIGSKTVINAQLSADDKSLNEVVVVGYGTQRKSEISGAVSVITPKEIAQNPSPNLSNALVGQTAGIIATQRSG
jgi:hypothetical protein